MDHPQPPRVCVSICEPTVAALERAITSAAAVCDLIEVRLDCLTAEELAAGSSLITKLLEHLPGKSILTFRPAGQGGRRELDDETRHAFWSSAIFSDSYFDVELDLAERFIPNADAPSLPVDWSRTICSQHDFAGVPANPDQLYDRLANTPARVLKIAVHAGDAIDCLPVFQLLGRARQQGRDMIAIAMGPAGIATRILGPSRGAFLTYASLNQEAVTAPGQISVRELNEVYRLEEINHETKIFGLVGLPVSHSVSPQMQNAAFAATGMNAVYIPFEVRDLDAFVRRMVHPRTRELDWNLAGLSVTAPHKSAVMDHLDWIAPEARELGVVNTIVIEGDELRGHNTDAAAFIQPLAQKFGDLNGARCAIIGAGGAATAALGGLTRAGATVTLFARNAAKSVALAERFGVDRSDLAGANFLGFDIVINATPLGTAGYFADESAATAPQLRGARLAYDLVYNPIETKFLLEARAAGCETLGGLAMLVAQAAAQFRLWTGTFASLMDTASLESLMHEAAERELTLRSQNS
jgi:3-dehydroquinate dehydratase/shikimate dehydrogenase